MKYPSKGLKTPFLALLTLFTSLSWGMTFERQERCLEGLNPKCQTMILAAGQIDKETPKQFRAFAQDYPRGTWVAITSPGGNLVGGMQFGMAIRELGFNSTIGNTEFSPPDCLSACAYAFAGGVSRKLPPGSRYGLHQFRGTDQVINPDEAQKISATLAKYLDAMGVDRKLLDYAQMTSSDKVTILSLTQAQQLRVDTAGQSSYGRWRIEATPDSKLLAVNNSLLTSTSRIPITLGIMPIPRQSTLPQTRNQVACLIFYKSADGSAFSAPSTHRMQLGQDTYLLTAIDRFQDKSTGYQATFLVPDNLLNALLQTPDDTVVTLLAEFTKLPESHSNVPSKNPVTAYFGVGNLRNSLQALIIR